MPPNPAPPTHDLLLMGRIKPLLGGLSMFTMVMTVPQVLTIWIRHQAPGVSLLSWSVPRLADCLALVRLAERHKNIFLPCVGWLLLDAAVIVGSFNVRLAM